MKVTSKQLELIREQLKKAGVVIAKVTTDEKGTEIFIKVEKKDSITAMTIANVFSSVTEIQVNVSYEAQDVWTTTLDDGKTFYVEYQFNGKKEKREFRYSENGFQWTVIKPEYITALYDAFKFFNEVNR